MEYRTRIIEKAIENHLDVKTTNDYLKLLEKTDSQRVLEIRIGTFAEATGNYKTVAQRCNELGLETIGDLVRYGGREMRKHENIGVKTAALISDTLQEKFGIDNWFSKEKEVDMVEPKFKVGDWITDGEAIFHVTSYDINYGYQLETQKGTLFHFSDEKVENKYHLWTIKDAKDGDVLQLGEVTAIFKKYIGQEKCICYCSVCEGEFEIPIENGEDNIYGCTNTTPATKEQRDLLFQKMKEAGYEWNAELKKVSKITTPADVGFEELGKVWAEEANKQSLANSAKTCKKSQRMISAEAKEALYDKPACDRY